MSGIVSVLDTQHDALVRDLWNELAQNFGLTGIAVTPFPHFTYQIAEGYDFETLEPLLKRLASNHAPFRVRASGLGIFTGEDPVLYVPVARGPELAALQGALWSDALAVSDGISGYYHPSAWHPHITLAQRDRKPAALARVVERWSGKSIDWDIAVDGLAVVEVMDTVHRIRAHYPFEG